MRHFERLENLILAMTFLAVATPSFALAAQEDIAGMFFQNMDSVSSSMSIAAILPPSGNMTVAVWNHNFQGEGMVYEDVPVTSDGTFFHDSPDGVFQRLSGQFNAFTIVGAVERSGQSSTFRASEWPREGSHSLSAGLYSGPLEMEIFIDGTLFSTVEGTISLFLSALGSGFAVVDTTIDGENIIEMGPVSVDSQGVMSGILFDALQVSGALDESTKTASGTVFESETRDGVSLELHGSWTMSRSIPLPNSAPIANPDHFSIPHDRPRTHHVQGNDVDPDRDNLEVIVVSPPTTGTLGAAGSNLTFTPPPSPTVPVSFTYKLSDGFVMGNTTTVTFNYQPIMERDSYAVAPGQSLVVDAENGVLENDRDVEGDPLEVVNISPPDVGTLIWEPDGSFVFTAPEFFTYDEIFGYEIQEEGGLSHSSAVTIRPINVAPISSDNVFTVAGYFVHNHPVREFGVLRNDIDHNRDILVVNLLDDVEHGELTLLSNGGYMYQPGPNFVFEDSFSYKANDGEFDGNVAVVTFRGFDSDSDELADFV